MTLPGRPGPRLEAIHAALADEEKAALVQALVESATPAEVISAILAQNGHPVSASTIRTYRRSLRREGVTSV
ncbi:hypothetical protein SEA_BROPLEASE_43 [Streptomyces phage BroPlease]|uniref:Uncharacterized protein n=1 Tax=Streptomyces phage phiHau3 TaxID=1204524 RepID=K4HY35_9CAUD|nr:hypothetical protein phiHau3_44 [Streptomyces phage phiHau3]AFU62021.1 hypothetical protein phiHau3_44 [Streptomyces phage phiHau3]USH44628.1 hypothetical protein SEA_BROPLEASE_43 [Streptomyces phage BroPlease]USH44962.1 hypothetical protein SEA_GREENWEASEL_44 [Streptomyces phage GreenWeasel]